MEVLTPTTNKILSHWHAMSTDALLDTQKCNSKRGLSLEEVKERLTQYGPNALPEYKRRSVFTLFLKQFQSPLIYLLVAAATIAFLLKEVSDAAVILVVVVLNSLIGAFQEGKAEKSLESLRELSKLIVTVRRDARDLRIEARELVPGDIFLLGAGDAVAAKRGINKKEFEERFPRKNEIPFDSSIKMMATEHQVDKNTITWIKGAPEKILKMCGVNEKTHQIADEMAQRALRVIAFAEIQGPITEEMRKGNYNGDIKFLGLMGQMDPPRNEVRSAVEECLRAGIRPVMVTGDHKRTGQAIGEILGFMRKDDEAVDGTELEKMSEKELEMRIERISVFARVHPEQKLRIIQAFQKKKNVVAMTGDGVNDAPALVRADVGVAMGITGTDTAKESAKIIITDDNFATIVEAVKQGRLVYRNVKKLILFLFSTSISELIVLFTAILLGYPPPLAAVQILWINLVTDGALSVNLIMEPEEGDEMRQRPIPRDEPLIDPKMTRRILLLSPTIAISTLCYFLWAMAQKRTFAEVQTETFTVVAVAQWFNALNCRSVTQSVFKMNLLSNKWLVGGLVAGNLLQAFVIYAPFMNRIFHTTPIPLKEALTIGLVGSSVLWVEEIRKFFVRRKVLN